MSRRRRSEGPSTSSRNLGWGLGYGLTFAAAFAALALLQFGLDGAVTLGSTRLSVFEIVLGYLLAGTAAGVLIGVCRPVLSTLIGGMLLGPAVGVVVYAAVSLAASGWRAVDWSFALFAGILSGLVVGTYFGWRAADRSGSDW